MPLFTVDYMVSYHEVHTVTVEAATKQEAVDGLRRDAERRKPLSGSGYVDVAIYSVKPVK